MIQEFTESKIATIRELLIQRYREDVEIHLTHSEVMLSPDQDYSTKCPTVLWHVRDANFAVVKTGRAAYRTQFFYTPHDQFGTGVEDYGDLKQCVTAVLRSHADHESEREGIDSGNAERSSDQEHIS